MEIMTKEAMLITTSDGMERTIRQGTSARQKGRMALFPDTTKTFFIGFPIDVCCENPSLFKVVREIHDRDVPLRDVMLAVASCDIPDEYVALIRERLNEL